jgi:hypothetical protein
MGGVVGADGVGRSRAEAGHARGLSTVFGSVMLGRKAYRAPGAGNLYPADAAWNMPEGLHSHGLRRLVALESVRGSLESAQAAIERATGVRVGKRQVEQLAASAAVDISGFYADRSPVAAGRQTLLVLTCDGKGGGDASRRAACADREGRSSGHCAPGYSGFPWREGQPETHGGVGVCL